MPLDLLGIGNVMQGVGGVAGAISSARSSKKALRESKRQFRAQMDESIQRRVKDAEKAGVHPLFALGASVGASPTLQAGTTGGGIGDALEAAGRAASGYGLAMTQKKLADAQAGKDEAQRMLYDAQRKKIEQELASQGRDGVSTFPVGTYPDAAAQLMYGPVETVAPKQSTTRPGDPSTRSGMPATYIESYAGDGYVLRSLDQDVHQADMVNDAYLAKQIAEQWYQKRYDKKHGVYKLQLPDGRWRRFQVMPSKRNRRGRRRGHGARR